MFGWPIAYNCTFTGLLRSASKKRGLRSSTHDVHSRFPARRYDGAGCGVGCQMGRGRGLLVLCTLFLCAAALAQTEPAPLPTGTVTISEYIAELDRLASTARQLATSDEVPKLLNSIPPVWRVQAAQQAFEVRSEWLRRDLNDWQKAPSQEVQDRMLGRLQILRSE